MTELDQASTIVDLGLAVATAQEIASEVGRDDFAARLGVATARMRRPSTIVCVVGEFKQGKSSLVNAMLGATICPVDDDIATSAITLLRHGDAPRVDVRRRVDHDVVVEQVEPSALADWVSEQGNPDNVKGVERVDIALPHPLLANGLVLVDTPGMGGLGAGHAAATLAFLPFADGLVFVTDASSEISAPEYEFLKRAGDLCPNVAFALTKTDLYPAWRQIAEINRSRGVPLGEHRSLLPVSSTLFQAAAESGDESLADQSGMPALLAALDSWIIEPAKRVAALRAATEAFGVLDQIEHQVEAELEVIEHPDRLADTTARLADATAHLERLRGPGARWSILVADRVTDLSNATSQQFRGAMRDVLREMEDSIEVLKSPDDWEKLAKRLQTAVADAVTDVFVEIERSAQATRDAVVELLGEESLDSSPWSSERAMVDLESVWSAKSIDPQARRGGRQFGSALTGLRGAQSGIIMFGMMGSFLPAGAAALMMSNPVTIGIGAVFAGIQLADARQRKVAVRRQMARANVRQFLDDVQFTVGNEIGEVIRDIQRSIRDEFTDRIAELIRTYSDTAQQFQRTAAETAEGVTARGPELRAMIARIQQARETLAGLASS